MANNLPKLDAWHENAALLVKRLAW
jgi:hypothetical protein